MKQQDALMQALDVLCPMHVVLGRTGHVIHAGPTLQKLRPEAAMVGRRFLEIFDLKRPRAITTMDALRAAAGTKLHLQLRDAPKTEVKGLLMPGLGEGQSIVNLSFGISVVDAVSDYSLTSADFAATDLTIEMLYLVEAKSAAMEASRKLNLRLQGAMIAAEEQAFTDTLTGLKNRRAMDHVMARHVDWGTRFGLMQVDLDWFKAVNDTLGHAAGDHVLQTVARIMVEETRDSDTVARVGGDEFVIILPHAKSGEAMEGIGRRIIERLSRPIPFQGEVCKISASIGSAIYDPVSEQTVAEVMDDADVALYASKHGGRGQQTNYTPALRRNTQNLAPPTGRDVEREA
ncbi:diguanylate cyclase [Tateyamaria omphalii]|uniref:diguanylate cyclase domain-containing protein n=1 Tax=Tateyamaria omphalii TaxID=299262 RepID=UPI001C99F3D4|nr:GGDEF domain-containing protein [Tateyamaria omphalii]MBY5932035.1 diguanylate cyclase [Tateyamaria omphalii]